MTDHTPTRTRPPQGSYSPEDYQKRKHRFLWMLILLTPACLWLTAQVALFGLGTNRVEDTVLSSMAADYNRWQPQRFNPLKPDLIGTIRADQLTLVALPGVDVYGTVIPFISFGTGTPITETPSVTPTVTSTPTLATRTPTPTYTPTIIWPPLRTDTPIATVTTVVSPTWTPIPPTSIPPTAVPPTIAPPTVQFHRTAYSVNEDMGNASIVVILSAVSSQTITVGVDTSDGSATASDDYTNTSVILTFLPGQISQIVDISIIDDTSEEGSETLSVVLSNPVNAIIGANDTATLTIVDDDPVPATPCSGYSGPYTLATPALAAVDNNGMNVACGQAITIDLGSTPIIADVDAAFDLVVYELQQTGTNNIEMDWVIVQVGTSNAGPWLTVFYWGDGGPDANTSLGRSGFTVAEGDNEVIPMANPQLLTALVGLPLITGIGIDVDAFAPPGVYQWLRIFAPNGGTNDPAQVDYIQIIS